MKCEVLARLTHTHELVNSLLTPVQVARSLVAGFPRPPDGLAVCLWVAAGEGDPDAVATLSAFGVGGIGGEASAAAGGLGGRGQQQQQQQQQQLGASPAGALLPLPPLPPFPDLPPPPAAASNFASALPMEAGGSNAALDGGGGSATITTGLE